MMNSLDVDIARRFGLEAKDVHKIADSFFSVMYNTAKRLPFDDSSRIYSKAVFDKHSFTYMIPYIGRIGPVYSRYLSWRANVAKALDSVPRPARKDALPRQEIERLAELALSGVDIRYEDIVGKRIRDDYKRVWLVSESGRRQARQLIKK